MKRMKIILLITVCVLAIGSWSYAQGQVRGNGRGCGKCVAASDAKRGINYVDNDGDGICDNAGSRKGKGNGQGSRYRAKNAAGNGSQQGPRYVDEDGNGICDNLERRQEKTE